MSFVGVIRAWLRLFRAHTAVLETPLAVLGAALGIGTIWNPVIILWAIFGIVYHWVGYGMNSYVDWKKGFDKDDPRKQHHPLNTGEISPEAAKLVIMGGLVLLTIYGLALGNLRPVAIIAFAVMLASGISYNYFGKYTDFKFIPISIVHTGVFVYPYILYSENLEIGFMCLAGAYFIHHIFQIMISGDVKDIDQDEASLIKRLGATIGYGVFYNKRFEPGDKVLYLTYSLCVIELILATAGLHFYGVDIVGLVLIIIFGLWMFYEAENVVLSGPFHREQRVSHMSRKELAGYLMIHSSVIPVLGIEAFIIVLVFMFGYLLPMSKFMWGTFITPKV